MNNSEIKRNIWLEFTKAKAIISPVLALSMIIIVSIATKNDDYSGDIYQNLLVCSAIMIGIILFVWGMKLASESVTSEISDRTWIFQRMSSISAFDMTLGKLFGSTVYTWYTSMYFFIIYFFCAFHVDKKIIFIKFGVLMILFALILHALLLLVSLSIVKYSRERGHIQKNATFILGVILAFQFTSVATKFLTADVYESMKWYILPVTYANFILLSALFFASWLIVGVYRLMRVELQYDNTPFVWCLFLLSYIIYFAGITSGMPSEFDLFSGNIFLWTSFYTLAIVSYCTIVSETFNLVEMRKAVDRFRKRHWKELAIVAPIWVPTFGLLVITTAILVLTQLIYGNTIITDVSREHILSALPIAILCLIIRDLGIISYIKTSSAKKAPFYIFFYLLVVYAILPIFFSVADADIMLHCFYPIVKDSFSLQIIPLAIEAIIATYIFWSRRKNILFK
ncbi:MAG: hypothetical protein PF692_00110 [Kiritimatiellae bacterium]|jgi:hypothetical protein|nr:hypothetical protein [Kiritimatiellia bacterium]